MSFLGNLFGSGSKTPQVNYKPPNFSSPGLDATFSHGAYNVSQSPQAAADLSGLQSTFQQAGGAFGNIAQQWAPGSSNLRAALMQQLQNQRTQGLGDLRQNLAQRRILGSSFAQASLANADMQYQQNAAQIEAQTYLQELQATADLTQKQFASYASGFQSGLTQMNFDAGLAAQLTGQASQALLSAATTNAQLQAQAQAGAGSFLGLLGGGLLAGSGGFSGIGNLIGKTAGLFSGAVVPF